MKNPEIKKLSSEERNQRIIGEKENLRKLKFAHSISAIENPMKIRETRRLIARLLTHKPTPKDH